MFFNGYITIIFRNYLYRVELANLFHLICIVISLIFLK